MQKTSLIDYPGHVSCIVFTQGCNLRCPYCHNPELVYPELFCERISEKDVFDFLNTRIEKLEGVVITGGEPTLHDDLPDFIAKVKALGFKVKLDTNGTNPEMLEFISKNKLVDFIAMDIKAPFNKYDLLSGVSVDLSAIEKSINIIEMSGIDYLFRTTMDKTKLNDEDISAIRNILKDMNSFIVQKCIDYNNKQ
ncbi:MAG: anaerobic ribonucleoside-triphosphate reductase activating protein [Candidatus Omnitrophica bacterium]|nr:anaerobic ribonucleoside-triphosphate reductase activating protein [Candidatus Omnitrophota bacterium]MDD5081205.1 anaerobic ribonucleoside-triphosphate reductase activating protein [Candidatus Omnitrophota bacterium]MDD5441384.1 anaerobic ribonucleoside-triphosphate reductase activating protein [Candidatus Omnitrophota bacterium]